jgi:uronate dehydrogenase
MDMKRVLLTGAAGSIGTAMRNCLGSKYHFRCLDIKPIEDEEDVVIADFLDFDALFNAMQGMDAVIHLATNPGFDSKWEDVYSNGIAGTYNVFEAARTAGIKKVIYASTTAVLGWREMQLKKKVSPAMPIHPLNLYGVGKATGELLARYFAETYQISIICLRIGAFYVDPPFPQSLQDDILRGWCSQEDLAQLMDRCLETEDLGFQVFYAVSDNKHRFWDIQNARKRVGYHPRSNADTLFRASGKMDGNSNFSEDRILLMRAAVQDDPGALESWKQWLEMVDLEKEYLDSFSYRLLPIVYQNLASQHIDHPLMARLKGVYRRAWLENQFSLQQVIPFITQLHDRGIPVMLLDDLSSILRLYDGQGVRRPYSVDILVQPADVSGLLRFLEESHIWPKVHYGKRFLTVETPLEVWPPFALPLSVAWRVFPSIQTHAQAAAAWQAGSPASLGDCPVFTLDLESHFLRTCLRANRAKPEAAFFALIDVAQMLGKQADKIDWEQVVELARSHHQVLPVVKSIREILSFTEMPRGDALLQQLQKLPVSWLDRLDHQFMDQFQPFPNFFTRAVKRLLLYRRSPKLPEMLGFFRYLQYAWGGRRLLAMPRLAIKHFSDALHRSGQE